MSRNKISEIILGLIIALITYVAFLYIYKNSISPTHLYLGYNYRDLSLGVHCICVGFLLFPLLWIQIKPRRPSDVAIWLLYMFSYAPTTFVSFHVLQDPFPDALFLLMALLLALILIELSRHHRIKLSFPLGRPLFIPLDAIFLILSIILCVYIFYLIGYNFNLDFEHAYVRRLAIRESSSLISGYVLAFGRSVIIIFSVYMLLVKKSKLAFITIIILSIGIYSYDGTKNALILPLFLVLIFILLVQKRSNIAINIILLFMVLASIVEFAYIHTDIISTYLTRRIFAVPGILNSFFWEYYSNHEKVMMADSVGRYFINASNIISPTYTIGYEYLNNIKSNANTGIWMGSYAHFGLIGILSLSMVAGFILGLVDNLTKVNFAVLGYLVCAYIGILWSEQMLHTSMLTGGIFYILISLIVYCNPNIMNSSFAPLNPEMGA